MEMNQKCHDCKTAIDIDGDQIKNGVMLSYKESDKEYRIFKCNDCYKASARLSGYKPCEVYSRVCGYLRPVGQWNQGKQQEYEERKEYKNS
jgi:anaerobic ribonucleoside-triphosphate reductase